MRSRAIVAVALAAVASLAACGGGGGGGAADTPCESAAPELDSAPPVLPPGFPTPTGVRYTSLREAGPSDIVEGYFPGTLRQAFDAWEASIRDAGFGPTFTEIESTDAEVNFEGGGTDGQVRLEAECADRTQFTITIRPL